MSVDIFLIELRVKLVGDLLWASLGSVLLFREYMLKGCVFEFGHGLPLFPEPLGADDLRVWIGLFPRC